MPKKILLAIKEFFKKIFFREDIKIIEDGILYVIYCGDGKYRGVCDDYEFDGIFSITEETKDIEFVRKQLSMIPFDIKKRISKRYEDEIKERYRREMYV